VSKKSKVSENEMKRMKIIRFKKNVPTSLAAQNKERD
jgi:hypothetical protein